MAGQDIRSQNQMDSQMGAVMGMTDMDPIGAIGGASPQDKGYGIGAPGTFQEYSTGPGLQVGQANPGMDLNLMDQGAAEQYFGATVGGFLMPGQGQEWQARNAGAYAQGGPVSNYAEREYLNMERPDVQREANLNKYYDRAEGQMSDSINRQMAARGMFGSSAALDQLQDASTGLRSEQANREADYRLRALGEQRAWQGLGGQLASSADTSGRLGSQNQLQWLNSGGQMAMAAEAQRLNALNSGMNAATQAQMAERTRGQDYFGNTMGLGSQLAGISERNTDAMLQDDSTLMNNSIMFQTGLAEDAVSQGYRGEERAKDDGDWGMDKVGQITSMVGM
jgi:hypothetical protein